jgi:acylpyruvate hydrolase
MMQLVRFEYQGKIALGLRRDGGVQDLSTSHPPFPNDLGDVLNGEEATLDEIRKIAEAPFPAGCLLNPADLNFLPPIARPAKIICLGVNYLDHAQEAGLQKPDALTAFMRTGTSLGGNGQSIILPKCSSQLDYEAELVVFIGKKGYRLGADNALEIVAGYAVFNDGSIRDYQLKASQWTMGKNFDGTGIVGDFVPAEEVPPGASGLRVTTRLNGNIMQDANTRDMLYDVRETIVVLSELMTLEPGDMIAMGTPGGVGLARTPPVFMKAGDVCEIEIEGIGKIVNPIVAE